MEQPYKDQALNVDGHKQHKNPCKKLANSPPLSGAKTLIAHSQAKSIRSMALEPR
jgi:hypothetical protein